MFAIGRSMLVLGLFLALTARGQAEDSADALVRDQAELFRPTTRRQLDEEIRDIRRLYHRDLSIETVKSLSPEEKQQVKALRSHDERRYLSELGRGRAQAMQVDGVHILISLDPRRVVVTVWPESQQQTFSLADAENVRKKIAHRLLVGRLVGGADRVVLDAVERVKRILHSNLSRDDPERGLASGTSMALVIGTMLAVWLVLHVASKGWNGAAPSERESPATRAAALGGMLGTPASLWIYDRLFPPPVNPAANGSASEFEIVPPPEQAAPRWPTQPAEGASGVSA